MNVSLTPELEEFVKKKVESGRYYSASEVIREALRLLEEEEHLRERRVERLRKEIEIGLKSLEEGRKTLVDDEVIEDIKARGRRRLAEARQKAA